MDTNEIKRFPADLDTGGARGDSTAVMLAAESLSDAACPQPRYQHLVEAEVIEAMPGTYMMASRRAVETRSRTPTCSRPRASSSWATCAR